MTNLQTIHVDEISFVRASKNSGSNMVAWNVSLNGKPFGQVWTFRNTKTDTHRFHAKTLKDDYADFATKAEAFTFIRSKV